MNLPRYNKHISLKPLFYIIIFIVSSLLNAPQVQAQQSFQPAVTPGGEWSKTPDFLSKQKRNGFEENNGQVTGTDASKVKYTYKSNGLSVFLMQDGIAYQFAKIHYPEGYTQLEKSNRPQDHAKRNALSKEIRTETYRMDVQLIDANIHAKVVAEDKSTDYANYYNHNVLDVHSYSKVTYKDIYPKIDWVVYTSGDHIKYDFVVHPGGNPAQIRLRTKHVEDLKPGGNGDINLTCSMGTVTDHAPVSYQNQKPVATQFAVHDGIISFNISHYSTAETLIIDPTLVWATYYGGSDEEYGDCCVTDNSGMVYLSGRTTSANNIASGGHQNTYGGGFRDAFLVKFNSNGIRQWATYYGGSGDDDGDFCCVDNTGAVYLSGNTTSTNNIASGGHQNTYGGGTGDAFLVKFNGNGIRQWGTYYGGSSDDGGYCCKTDNAGNVYLAGTTTSQSGIASGGFQNLYAGGSSDGYLVKFNSNGVRQWATYYGSFGDETGGSCAIDNTNGSVYFGGDTNSSSGIASGGHQNTYGGGQTDVYLVKFNSSGTRLWCTYYGGTDYEFSGHTVSTYGTDVYLAGGSYSANNIASSGAFQTVLNGTADAFLAKFNGSGVRQWATYYGGGNLEGGRSCHVDNSGSVFLAGETHSNNNIASGGYQSTFGGGALDGYIVKFNAGGVRQWGSFYGGNASDVLFSCTTDAAGALFVAGYTTSASSIASGGHQNTYGGGTGDAFLAKFVDCPPIAATKNITICANLLPYTWNSIVVPAGGVAIAVYHTPSLVTGCDSATTLNLTVNPLITVTKNISICSNQLPYVWNSFTLNAGGTGVAVYHTPSLVTGCDSATTLNLTVNPVIAVTKNIAICANQLPYLWNSFTLNAGGTGVAVYHTPSLVTGCDSATTLNLTVNPLIAVTKNITICASQLPYAWNSFTLNAGGTGVAVYHTPSLVSGCDSATTLNLTVNPLITTTKNITICGNQLPYIWNGFTLNTGGNGAAVYHTPSLVTGCDSATTLNLTVSPVITVIKNVAICTNQLPYIWNGFTLNTAGTTVYHTPSLITGCDSATTLNLIVHPLITTTKSISICANQLPYVWNSFTLNAGGTGVAVYHTPSMITGCDSATTLNLIVNPLITTTKNITICANQIPYVWNSFTLNAGGTGVAVYHTPSLVTGCDSATTLNLTVNPLITATKNITICASQLPYVWNSFTLTAGGTGVAVYHTPSLVTGCDSATTLNLTVNPLITAAKNITICANLLPYVWNSISVTTGGPGAAVYHTPSLVTGCDSATTLNLTVNPLITVTKNITICANQLPYIWNNSTINASGPGVAVYHTPSLVTGCDSATTLNLTVNPLIAVTKNITICANELPYVWNNSTINASGPGVAVYHTPSLVTGCDSATTLNLTVNPLIAVTKNMTICSNQLPYLWNSITVNAGGTGVAVYHTPSLITGCDSATTLNLTVLNIFNTTASATICYEALPYLWGVQNLNASGTYVQTFTATSGCDSTVTLSLTVRPAPAILQMDTTACGLLTLYGNTYYSNTHIEDTLNNMAGCDSIFRKLNITISSNIPALKEMDTAGCGKVTFEGQDYFDNTTLIDTLSSISGCDSVARKVNIFVESLDLNLTATPQEVYKGESIQFVTTANIPYTVYAWSPYGWFPDQYLKEQNINGMQSGVVMVWGQSTHGCVDSAMVTIKVYTVDHAVYIPNAFSPNGDGLNDIFRPNFNVEKGFHYVRFGVFNRWGQRVYQAANVEQAGWDGSYNGQMTDMGTYSYVIEIEFRDGEKRIFKGNVELIR